MSGTGGVPSDIPIRVTTGDSAAQVAALGDQFKRLRADLDGFANAFKNLSGGTKELRTLLGQLRSVGTALSTVSAQVSNLNALSRGGSNTVSAANELSLQRALADPQRVGNALATRNPSAIRTAQAANRRLEAEYTLRQQQLTTEIERLTTALQTAPTTGKGSRTPGVGASSLRRELAGIQTEFGGLTQLLDVVRQGRDQLERALAGQNRSARFNRSVQSRIDNFYANQLFQQTPEFQTQQAIRAAERAQRDLVRAQRQNQDAEERAAAAEQAARERAAKRREQIVTKGAFDEARNLQRARDREQEIEDQRVARRERILTKAAFDEVAKLRRAQEREANALPDAIARRLTGAQAESAILTNPAQRGVLLNALGLRTGANAEALARLAQTPDFLANRTQIGLFNRRISQNVQLGLFNDPTYQANEDEIAQRRADERLRQRRARFADADRRAEERNLINAQNQDRLFGDGGGALFNVQARLLLNYTILNQFQNALVTTTQAVVQFDDALKLLQAISASTNGEMDKLSKTILDVSTRTRFSATELTQAATTMAQAGLGISEIGKGLEAVAVLATSTGTQLATAVDIMTTAISVFRLRADEMPRVADQMTAALNLSKLTIDQLSVGFQYVSNTAAEAGLSFAETTAAMATLANQGIRSGSTLGTGFRQLLVDLQQPNEQLRQRMRELGLTMADIDVRANGLTGVFENLRRAGFTSADAFATIELRAAAAFTAFSRGQDEMLILQRGIVEATGAVDANATAMESLIARFIRLGNVLVSIVSTAAAPFIDLLKGLVTGFTDLIEPLTRFETGLKVIGSALVALTVGGVVRFLAGLAASFVAAQAAISAATVGAVSFGAALRAIPFVAWIAAGTTAIAMLTGFGSETNRATAATQRSQEALNEAKSAYDSSRQALQGLEEFMATTIARSRALRENQELLNATISEAQSRFGALSSAVRTNISTYGQLIDVLKVVRSELAATLALQAATAAGAAGEEVRRLSGVVGTVPTSREFTELARRFGGDPSARGFSDFLARNAGNYQSAEALNADALLSILPPAVRDDPRIIAAFRQLGSGVSPTNREQTAEASNAYAALVTALSQPGGLGGNLTDERRRAIIQYFEGRARSAGDLSRALGTQTIANQNLRVAEFANSPQGRGINNQITDVNQQLTDRLRGVSQIPDIQGRERELAQLRTWLESQIDGLRESARTFDRDSNGGQFDTAQRVLETSSEFGNLIARARQAGIEVQRERVRAEAVLTDAAQRAAQRESQEAIARGRNLRDPAAAQRAADEAEAAVRRGGAAELATIRARRTADAERDGPLPPDVAQRVAQEDERGIASQITRQVQEVRRAATEAAVQGITSDLEKVTDDLRTLTQRGRTLTPQQAGDRERLRSQGVELIRQRGALRGDSQQQIENDIAIFQGRQGRAQFAQERGAGGGRYSSARDPNLADVSNYAARLRNIERATVNDRTEAEAEVRAIRAQQDAYRLLPDRATEAGSQRLDRQLNEAQVRLQERLAAQARARRPELDEMLAAATNERTRIDQRLTALGGDRAPINEETRSLRTEQENLTNIIDRINETIRAGENTIQVAEALVTARASSVTGSVGDALTQAGEAFNRRFGGDKSLFRQFTDDVTEAFGGAQNALSEFLFSFSSGAKTASQAARDMALGILKSIGQIASNRAATALLNLGLQAITGLFPGGGTDASAGATSSGLSNAGINLGRYEGGMILSRYLGGGMVRAPHIGRDTVPALLAGGEAVLNRRAVSLVGEEMVSAMNQGRVRAESAVQQVALSKREPDQVSVYVLAPNERPSLGPKDVLAVIGQDVLTGGQTKALIKQVAVGAI